jgi:hypothetical protein
LLLHDESLAKAEEQALAAVNEAQGQYSPTRLIDHLTEEGLPEESVRAATWDLIYRKQMTLNRDFTLSR